MSTKLTGSLCFTCTVFGEGNTSMQTQVDAAMLRRENISFEGVWADIRRRLRVGTTIRNWGAVQGYTGKTFCIVGVDDTAIMVRSVRMNKKDTKRLVSKGEFERFFPVWPAYKAGTVQRTALTAASHNTTYVISILHWQETPEG